MMTTLFRREYDLPPTESQKELDSLLKDYVGRETPLYFAERLSQRFKRYEPTGVLGMAEAS
jgi:tryptophan synthase beta subunit